MNAFPERVNAAAGRSPAMAPPRAKIAVIDDDRIIRELVALHLRNDGYEVIVAADAIDGGHMILAHQPDLIVCDIEMPYLNGYELAAALKADPSTKHIPIVFLTVNDDVGEKAARLGAAAYLRKPVTSDRLLRVVGLLAAQN